MIMYSKLEYKDINGHFKILVKKGDWIIFRYVLDLLRFVPEIINAELN